MHRRVKRVRAFTFNGEGGNSAGVVLTDSILPTSEMQMIARQVGDSETVFANPGKQNQWTIHYFSPTCEVTFCGHATLALGEVLKAEKGVGEYTLLTQSGEVHLEICGDGKIQFFSPPTKHKLLDRSTAAQISQFFGLIFEQWHPEIPPAIVNAGNDHALLPLAAPEHLLQFAYNFEEVRSWMIDNQIVTITLLAILDNGVLAMRNAFAYGGVVEDPATGAAAAAVTGYLRDSGTIKREGELCFYQGMEMGVPCEIRCVYTQEKGAGVSVKGQARESETLTVVAKSLTS